MNKDIENYEKEKLRKENPEENDPTVEIAANALIILDDDSVGIRELFAEEPRDYDFHYEEISPNYINELISYINQQLANVNLPR